RDAALPRTIAAETVLSPFDPVVWFRPRAERLFDFSYRIEIYTPAEKRQFGYYRLPVLLGEQVVARVDLKSDRPNRTLLVQSAWSEAHAPTHLVEALPRILSNAARWQGLERVRTMGAGNVAHELPEEWELS
ncbi:MAG: DNA glycosylase AlkZ-like family protein, partial [Agromyces sp.]